MTSMKKRALRENMSVSKLYKEECQLMKHSLSENEISLIPKFNSAKRRLYRVRNKCKGNKQTIETIPVSQKVEISSQQQQRVPVVAHEERYILPYSSVMNAGQEYVVDVVNVNHGGGDVSGSGGGGGDGGNQLLVDVDEDGQPSQTLYLYHTTTTPHDNQYYTFQTLPPETLHTT